MAAASPSSVASPEQTAQFERLRGPLLVARAKVEDLFFGSNDEIDPEDIVEALADLVQDIAVIEHQLNRTQKGRVFLIQLKGFVNEVERLVAEFDANPDDVPSFSKLRFYLEHQFKTSTVFNEPDAKLPWDRVPAEGGNKSSVVADKAPVTAAASGALTAAPATASDEPVKKAAPAPTKVGFAIGVESFVRPTIGHMSVKTYTNNNRQVTVSGNLFAEPVSAQLNGHAYPEVTMTKEGVGLVFHVPKDEYKDLGPKNELIITCNGTPSKPYNGSIQYENPPQLWSLRVHEQKQVDAVAGGHPYNIKGLNFAPGKTGVQVSISGVPDNEISNVQLLDDTTIDFYTKSAMTGERTVTVTVANVKSDPFLKDFDAKVEESEFQKLVQRRTAEATATGGSDSANKTEAAAAAPAPVENDAPKMATKRSGNSGFSLGRVDSYVQPRIGHVSVKTYANCNRQVTVSGSHIDSPVVVTLNGKTYDTVEETKQGVGVVFTIQRDDWVDKGAAQNDIVLTSKGVACDPLKVTIDYENRPQVWSCRADDVPEGQQAPTRDVRYTIKGLDFKPGKMGGCEVTLGRLALHDVNVVDDTTITFVLDHQVFEGVYDVVVTCAGAKSAPMKKDFALSTANDHHTS